MKIDSYGMIVTPEGDGGDSCHRMHTMFIRLRLMVLHVDPNFEIPTPMDQANGPGAVVHQLQPEKGIYIRHPDPTRWYSDPRNVSRDQLTPVIGWNSLMANSPSEVFCKEGRKQQWFLLKACLKRYMFAQNIYPNWVDPRTEEVKKKTPDFITPDLWAVMARAWIDTPWMPLALPVILLGDLFLVFSAMLKVWGPTAIDVNGGWPKFKAQGPNDVDDDNINNILMVTQYVFPTVFSNLARYIYKKFRKKNFGNTEMGEPNAIMGALAWYNRNDNPELTELARQLVARY